jgi:ABC-type sugar transport system permease subunit
MSLPSILFIAIVVGFPAMALVYLSVTTNIFAIGQSVEFVGLEHYISVITNDNFWTFFLYTWVYAAGVIGIGIPLQIGITVLLNTDLPFQRVWQTLIILPWAVPFVISTLIWKLLFQPEFGLINYVLQEIGLINSPILWFSSQETAFFTVIITTVWINTPLGVLIMLSGIKNVPGNLYEAARVDGASVIGRFRHVTLPLLKPAIVTALLIQSLFALRGFDVIFVMTRGGPGSSTTVIAIDMFQQLIDFGNTGYAAAESVILIVMILTVLIVLNNWLKSDTFEEV